MERAAPKNPTLAEILEKIRNTTPEEWEAIWQEAHEKLNPKVCTKCTGELVRKATTLFRGQFYYTVTCADCNQTYLGADQERYPIDHNSIREFHKVLRRPVTT